MSEGTLAPVLPARRSEAVMLVARVAPPLPDGDPARTVLSRAPAQQQVVELVAPPGGALARGLAADLAGLGYEVAWARPLRFEADSGSLAALVVMALSAARHAASGGRRPVVVVVESPTAPQADAILDQLAAPGVPFGPSVVLLVPEGRAYRQRPAGVARVRVPASRRREPGARTESAARRLLRGATAAELASLEMACHLGYAHERLGSLEPIVPAAGGAGGRERHPWWVPLEDGWWQVDPAWRRSLADCGSGADRAVRSACVSRLVAELAESDAVPEGIELCVNAGWPGLAADLLAGEAEALLAAGHHLSVVSWLERMPAAEARCHPRLAAIAADLTPGETAPLTAKQPVPVKTARRRWVLRVLGRRPGGSRYPRGPDGGPDLDGTGGAGNAASIAEPGRAALEAVPRQRRGPGAAARTGQEPPVPAPVRVEARLLGQFEVLVQGRPVQHWTGNKGRMLLAFLLLHRGRALSRGELGCAFWPDDEPGVVRNRLHVALHGLRKDLRALTSAPIVVHGQRGFSFGQGIDIWTDVEALDAAFAAAKRERAGSDRPGYGDRALQWYEKVTGLYRGELLADAPFEEWALLDRERLRLAYLEALDQVASLRFEAGRYADCLEACQRLLPGDMCREEIHRMAMRCYARLNQPHLAARQYHLCERQLRGELDAAPAATTRQLYERIRRREHV